LKGGGEKKSGTVEERTEIADNPDIESLHLLFGNRNYLGLGSEGSKIFKNSSRINASIFLFGRNSLSDDEGQQATPKNLFIRHFMSLSYGYPIISKANYRSGKMYLSPSFSSVAEARESGGNIYVLKDKFKVLHFLNLVGGIEHGYSNFRTETFLPVLINSYPDVNASISGSFGDVDVHAGSYYGKIGLSSTQIINTFLKGSVDGFNVSGHISRELSFSLNALIGIFGTIPTTDVEFRYFENGSFVYAEESVDFKELLNYERFGFEAGFHWIEYLPANLSFKYGVSLGLMPGYREPGSLAGGGLIKVSLGIGFGRIKK
jgi:hypothetical protein